jgi:hypothetical protein
MNLLTLQGGLRKRISQPVTSIARHQWQASREIGLSEAQAARLIIKIASGEEVTARVNCISDNPKPIIDEATALLGDVPE